MNTVGKITIVAALAAGLAIGISAQESPKVTTAAASKFTALPVFPACATVSAQRGDPAKGGAVLLAKMTSGCSIPWHWHTAGENLMMVSGKAKVGMKDGAASSPLAAGDYVYMPGKHVHQFSCVAACTFFVATEGVFDIHYVDKDGKEIPTDQAVAPKKPSPKPATKK